MSAAYYSVFAALHVDDFTSDVSIPDDHDAVTPVDTSDTVVLKPPAASSPLRPLVRPPVVPTSPMQLSSSSRTAMHAHGFGSGSIRRTFAADAGCWHLVTPRGFKSSACVQSFHPPVEYMLSVVALAASLSEISSSSPTLASHNLPLTTPPASFFAYFA